ncbi:putative membrane protein [Helicobacter pylori CPY1124]|nr:putative membrane protein [Helicobacter pylori CPY1124]
MPVVIPVLILVFLINNWPCFSWQFCSVSLMKSFCSLIKSLCVLIVFCFCCSNSISLLFAFCFSCSVFCLSCSNSIPLLFAFCFSCSSSICLSISPVLQAANNKLVAMVNPEYFHQLILFSFSACLDLSWTLSSNSFALLHATWVNTTNAALLFLGCFFTSSLTLFIIFVKNPPIDLILFIMALTCLK